MGDGVKGFELGAGSKLLYDAISVLAVEDIDGADAPDLQAHVIELVRLQQQLQAEVERRIARWDASKVWQRDGSKSAASRLARDAQVSGATARKCVSRARRVRDHLHVSAAWADGRLSTDHVDLLLNAAGGKRGDLFARDQEELVFHASRLLHSQAVSYLKQWRYRADAEVNPDGTEPQAQFLTLDTTIGGAVSINGLLDSVGGEIVKEALRRIEHDEYLADKANGVERTAAERQAAALVEMATRSMTAPAGGRRPEPLICVVAGTKTGEDLCRTLSGIDLDPAALTPYLTSAEIQSFLFADDGQSVSVSS